MINGYDLKQAAESLGQKINEGLRNQPTSIVPLQQPLDLTPIADALRDGLVAIGQGIEAAGARIALEMEERRLET